MDDAALVIERVGEVPPRLYVPVVAGSADLTWRIEVRVEAFDGRGLPAGAVSIVDSKR